MKLRIFIFSVALLVAGSLHAAGPFPIRNGILESNLDADGNDIVNAGAYNGVTLTLPIATTQGGTGLTTLGTPLQLLRVNAAGTGLEFWTLVGGGGGAGDVAGPGSSTDNAIALFDSTTGKLIKNSGITIAPGATGILSEANLDEDITGNAGTATALENPRTINGVSFDGSADITIPAAGSTLTDAVPSDKGGTGLVTLGTPLQVLRVNTAGTGYEFATISIGGGDALIANNLDQFAGVTQTGGTTLSITGNVTLGAGSVSGTNTGDQTTITGNAGSATILQNARTINGTSFNGSANITVTVPVATGITGLGTNVPALLATASTATNFNQFALSSSLAFSNLSGQATQSQINRARTVVTESATVTIPVNGMIKTSATGTLTTLAFAAGTPTEGQFELANVNFGSGLTYPFTFTFPSSKRLGEDTVRASLPIPSAGLYEFNWIYVNGEWVLADNVATPAIQPKRVTTIASSATPSINSNLYDVYVITALAVPITSLTITGTPTDGRAIMIEIKDNGTPKALAFGTGSCAYSTDLPAPTTTEAGKYLYCTFIWNPRLGKWVMTGKLGNI